MKRKAYDKMLEWKAKYADRYALMLDGARRVGKSWLAEEFAKAEYDSYVLIDFSKAKKDVKNLFDDYLDDLEGSSRQGTVFGGVRRGPALPPRA